jgi:hypothetical protein
MAATGLRQRKTGGESTATTKVSKAAATIEPHGVSIDASQGYLGVTFENGSGGARISELDPNDLVSRAGLKVGDVVLTINGVAVKNHKKALELCNEASGTMIELTYSTPDELKKAAVLRRMERRAKCWRILKWTVKMVLRLLVICAIGAVLAYEFLPQHMFKDPFDVVVLPRFGFDKPQFGVDNRPLRRVVRSKDPNKPWEVRGWSYEQETDAVARIKKMTIYNLHQKAWTEEGGGDPMKAKRPAHMLEQIRASGGTVLDSYEQLETYYDGQRKGFENFMIKREAKRLATEGGDAMWAKAFANHGGGGAGAAACAAAGATAGAAAGASA